MRITVNLVWQQAHHFHHATYTFIHLDTCDLGEKCPQGFGNNIAYGHPRVQCSQWVLENDLQVLAFFPQGLIVHFVQVFTQPQNTPTVGLNKGQQGTRKGRFPTAGFTDNTQCFTGIQIKTDTVYRLERNCFWSNQTAFTHLEVHSQILNPQHPVIHAEPPRKQRHA